MNFKQYKRKGLSEMIAVTEFIQHGGDMTKVSVSEPDQSLAKTAPHEFEQGFIARNPKNHEDLWYVAKKYFDENLEEAEPGIKPIDTTSHSDRIAIFGKSGEKILSIDKDDVVTCSLENSQEAAKVFINSLRLELSKTSKPLMGSAPLDPYQILAIGTGAASQRLKEVLQEYVKNVNESDNITETLEDVITSLEAKPKEETFMDRLIKERDELKDKFEKLTQFLESGKAKEVVSARQFEMLKAQQSFMDGYLLVLNNRIKELQAISSPSQN